MNFRQVNKKIKTIGNVRKITNAMQMVSAVKMRKAQKLALEGREYRAMLDTVLQRIISNTSDLKDLDLPWLKSTEGTKSLYILITSNKGLCGSFHTYLFKYALDVVGANKSDFIVVGQKGAEFISRAGYTITADFSEQQPFTDSVSAIFSLVEEKFATDEYKNVFIMYNKFISSFRNEPVSEQLLPVEELKPLNEDGVEKGGDHQMANYLIEPSIDQLLKPLVKDYIKEKIRSAIADSEAAEHSARMMAMKSATDNAGDIVYNLTLLRNKLRQSQITNELLDMVAAKESTEVN